MNMGASITTPHGPGMVVDVTHYNRLHGGMKRYGVELLNNPFSYSPVYYFEDEVGHGRAAAERETATTHSG